MKSPLTIMIVEDDEGHAVLIHENLGEQLGLTDRVEHLRDGQAVLDFFFDRSGRGVNRPVGHYLILLDIRMPKVDGIEVLRRLKADPELRKLPVIILSTTDDEREVERCHALGCNGYLQKPVDSDKFAEEMRCLGMFVSLLLVAAVSPA